mmetsp:Transcript_950/g.1163  ORF Transcript_950/g.1163 Transcript_950/m.1163 type:complete len:491 (-) Transcript_950:77-1549(-)
MFLRQFFSNNLFDPDEFSNIFSSSVSSTSRGQSEMGSVCQRLCQLPHLIARYAEGEEGTFQPIEASGSVGGSGNLNIITPLQRLQLEEENFLSNKYLVQENQSKPGGVSTKDEKRGGRTKLRERESMSYADPEAGKECEICSAHDKTHYAIPCGHSACLKCWSRWLYSKEKSKGGSDSEENKKNSYYSSCMICQRKIKRIRRYSFSLVPQRAYENKVMEFTGQELANLAASLNVDEKAVAKNETSVESLQIAIDDSMERVIRSLLDVKDALDADVVSKLVTVEQHLYSLTRPESGTTMDALASVLAVECLTVGEVFHAYKRIFEEDDAISKWKAIELEVAKLKSAVGRVSTFLGLPETVSALENRDSSSHKLRAELLSLKEALLVITAPTSIIVQWKQIKQLLHKSSSSHHLVPGIIRVFGLINTSSLLDVSDVFEIIESAQQAKEKMDKTLNKLLNEDLAILLSRIDSIDMSESTLGDSSRATSSLVAA